MNLPHENVVAMDAICEAARDLLAPGEALIRCHPFRWKWWRPGHPDHDRVISNAYEQFDAEQVASENGLELVWTMNYIAAVKPPLYQDEWVGLFEEEK